MPSLPKLTRALLLTLLVCALLGLSTARVSHAAPPRGTKTHRVFKGQNLGMIAKRYNVTVKAIRNANGIAPGQVIRPGQKLLIPPRSDAGGSRTRAAREEAKQKQKKPARPQPAAKRRSSTKVKAKTHTVARRQTLGSIARRYNITVEALRHANGLGPREHIRPKQKLLIPPRSDADGAETRQLLDGAAGGEPQKQSRAGQGNKDAPSWYAYQRRPRIKGYVTLVGLPDTRRWRGTAVSRRGNPLSRAREGFKRVLATADDQRIDIDPRLIKLLAQVSDTFGGRTIRIVSGYRLKSTSRESRHRKGKAADFTVAGVLNEVLRDYLMTLPDVGIGYYPRSGFVHLDVRKKWTYWIDYSGPGQRPRYAGFWTRPPREKR